MAKIEIPDDLVSYVIDALNCFCDCTEGNREAVEEIWFLKDDKTDTGGSFIGIAKRLQNEVAPILRKEHTHLIRSDPNLQDVLHRYKMWDKYGVGKEPK